MTVGNEVLIVLTNTKDLPEAGRSNLSAEEARRTGFDIKEVAYLFNILSQQAQVPLTFASPRGGECTIDPLSMKASEQDEEVKKFMRNKEALEMIKQTQKLEEIKPESYQAIIFPGGPGCLFDLPHNQKINQLVQQIWEHNQGFVCTIGHGIAALVNVKQSHKQDYLLKGKKVTCNTIEEEKDMQLDKALPFMLESKLKEIGARFEKANKNEPYVVVDERLITAQNRNSTREWVQRILQNVSHGQ